MLIKKYRLMHLRDFVGLILLFSVCFCGKKNWAQPAIVNKYERKTRLEKDTFIQYSRLCSGCITGTEVSTYFIYKKKKKYILRYFRWNNSTGRMIQKFCTTQKTEMIQSLIQYINQNFDTLAAHNGEDIHEINYTKQLNDTVTGDRNYTSMGINHGPIVDFYIQFKDKVLHTRLFGYPHISYYVEHAPAMGNLLLQLNKIYYIRSFDKFLDN